MSRKSATRATFCRTSSAESPGTSGARRTWCCKTLLTVDDEALVAFVACDDRSEEVVAVLLDLVPFVRRVVEVQELPGEIVDEFTDLSLLPRILALVEVDGVLRRIQDFSCTPGAAFDAFHCTFLIHRHAPGTLVALPRLARSNRTGPGACGCEPP